MKTPALAHVGNQISVIRVHPCPSVVKTAWAIRDATHVFGSRNFGHCERKRTGFW